MAKLSIKELKTALSSYVLKAKMSSASYTQTTNNTADLLDEIGKIFTLDTSYADPLTLFDGEYLEFGKDVEEWQQDLILPTSYDSTGANALAPNDPTYRPAFYSKTLGRKVFKTTVRNNDFERCVNNNEQLVSLVSMIMKRLYDSDAVDRYYAKLQMFAEIINLIETTYSGATNFATSTAYSVGVCLKQSTTYAVVVKAITVADAYASLAAAISAGKAIEIKLHEVVTIPTDTSTGEAFIKKVKSDLEYAQTISEGYSLNGNTLGAYDGLVLFVKQGIKPVLDVDVEAGAFNPQKLGLNIEVITVPCFGNDTNNVYAILCDKRIMKLHPTYRAIRSNENGVGDFINYNLHVEYTAHCSRNVFVKLYKSV